MNNQVMLSGVIRTDFKKYYTVNNKDYYVSEMEVPRKEGVWDHVTIQAAAGPEAEQIGAGHFAAVRGTYRSFDRKTGSQRQVMRYVLADSIKKLPEGEKPDGRNEVRLQGFVCRKPMYRRLNTRQEVTVLLIAVNRKDGGTDYAPCICWNGLAGIAKGIRVGKKVEVLGGLRSRDYRKRISPELTLTRRTTEISVRFLKILD